MSTFPAAATSAEPTATSDFYALATLLSDADRARSSDPPRVGRFGGACRPVRWRRAVAGRRITARGDPR